MTYIEGFVTPVPTANKDAYRAQAERAVPLFREFGAARFVEAWGDDVPRGKVNDLYGAVQATEAETVVFSFIEYPDKATRDAANQRMATDPRMAAFAQDMAFDGSRMIFSGFAPVVDDGDGRGAYLDGFVIPVAPSKRDGYVDMATRASQVFRDHGALRVVEAWSDDLLEGTKTDFRKAAHATADESVVFSWIEWSDKATRDAGMKAAFEDPRMATAPADMPFDGARMIYGGFAVLLDA